MNPAEIALKNKVISLVFVFLVIGGGFIAFENLGQLEDPEFTIKDALIITRYPGATPMETAQEVTEPIEIALQKMGQLKRVKSISRSGLSIIIATMQDKFDAETLPQVWDELRRKVRDAEPDLPPGAEKPVVYDDYGDVYGIYLALTGDGFTMKELKDYADDLKRELLLVKDVAKVELYGAETEVIYVEYSVSRMAELGIPQSTIFNTLAAHNLVEPSGKLTTGGYELRIRPTGAFASAESIGELLIKGNSDRLIRLSDIATIKKGYYDPPSEIMRFDGKPAIGIGISVVNGGNVVRLGEAIQKKLDELEKDRPYGMELGVVSYQSNTVTEEVNRFFINLIEALAIVIAVLLVTMGLRSGLIIGANLVLTILATFIFMLFLNIDLQRISLGALIIALGMLVDNAIVVTEGIMIAMQKGMNKVNAGISIVKQTMWPLLGATVTAVFAFAGIGFSPDTTGEYCRSLFQVTLISLMMSWVFAVTITPVFCDMFLNPKKDGEAMDEEAIYGHFIFRLYRKTLALCLRFRYTAIIVMIAAFIISLYGFGKVDKIFFPGAVRPQFYVEYWLPEGSSIHQTSEDIKKIEAYINSLNGVESVSSFIGNGGLRFILTYDPEKTNPSFGMILITINDYRKIDELIAKIEPYILHHFPESEPKFLKMELGPGGKNKVQARFMGPDPVVLRSLAEKAKAVMRKDPDAVEIRDDWRQPVLTINPRFMESMAKSAGITRADLALALQTHFSGSAVGLYREGDTLIPILARSLEKERDAPEDINNILIQSRVTGRYVPVGQTISGFDLDFENGIIRKRNRQYTIHAMCDTRTGFAKTILERIKGEVEDIPLPPGYKMEWGGEYETENDAQKALNRVLPYFFLAMIVTVIVLFNSIKKTFIIWLTIPLSMIGVTAGLLIFNLPYGFMALLGVLSLAGMMIKNGVVLIDQIDIDIKSGKKRITAIMDASVSRVRPVSMAALTTVLGMIPLTVDPLFNAMAVAIMFGLTCATLLTLLVIPVLYAIFFRIRSAQN